MAVLEVKRGFVVGMLVLAVWQAGCAPATEPVLADSYFSGQALLDMNNNGKIDSEDTPVKDATFIVELQGGGEFGGLTDETGKAFIIIPSSTDYPITVQMEAPEGSSLVLVEPSKVILSEATGKTIQFLFSSK